MRGRVDAGPGLPIVCDRLIRIWQAAALPKLDRFVLALTAVLLTATIMPCRGAGAQFFGAAGSFAIGALFFLQGARLSRSAIIAGLTHWRLQALIAAITFVFFPLAGAGLGALLPSLLPPTLWLGVLFLCVLPSTVQSSIALTSIARGNIAAAVCSAAASNFAGIVLTPLLFGGLAHTPGGFDKDAAWRVTEQLLLPFVAGQMSRPWIGDWAERNRALLSMTDRSSILIVVYSAFSGAVVHGLWRQLPPSALAILALVVALLLGAGIAVAAAAARALRFDRSDEATLVFCASQKSLVSGVPIARVLVSAALLGPVLLPIMLYHPLQLVVAAWLARRYGKDIGDKLERLDDKRVAARG
jgi:solute carrier family 10 (sodium/bile acid cotransporter), member 7